MKRFFLTLLCVISIFIVLAYPTIVTEGVRQGIKLNLYSVIPSLLPFMILTNIMIKYNLCEYISYIFKPVLDKIFKVSSMGCFAVVIGFTCGYPMGAKIIGDLYHNNLISKSEASYLITFCNNCSMSFLLNYILFECLNSELKLQTVLFLVYLPPIVTGIINKFIIKPDINHNTSKSYISINSNPIFSAAKSMSILCVYIICFTVISKCISCITIIPNILKCVLSGITEITSGSNFIVSTLANKQTKEFFVLSCTIWGGLSIMFQSFEQLPENFLKHNYIIGKLEQLLLFFLFYTIFVYI